MILAVLPSTVRGGAVKTNRMLECYRRINAIADDAATAWSIPQSACCDYPIKRVETCSQTRWLYCQASKGRLPASDCRACRHDEPNGGSHQEGLKRGAIKINRINLKAGCSSNRQDKANEGGINAGGAAIKINRSDGVKISSMRKASADGG
jgi:hypothetical protein